MILNPGDGMVYKGCERPHWRDPMPAEYRRTWYGRKVEKEGLYYHQIFSIMFLLTEFVLNVQTIEQVIQRGVTPSFLLYLNN